MMIVFDTIVPVFSIVALGYWLAGRRVLDLPTLSNLALMVTSPCLMFSVLSDTSLDPGRWGAMAGGALFVMAGTSVLALGYLRTRCPGRRGLILPSVFWNAGNMGLACSRLAFGPEGLEAAAIVFVTVSVFTSSAGIWIAKGENGLGEVIRMPLVYASVGGVAVAWTGTELPRIVLEPVAMLGDMAIPLLLLNLGCQLRALAVSDVGHSVAAVAIRMLGGAAFASLFVAAFGVTGVERQVLLLHAVMPAAVINAVMAQRYDTDPTLVASAIVIGTLASLVSIPVVLLLVT